MRPLVSILIFAGIFSAGASTKLQWSFGIEDYTPSEELKKDLPAYILGHDYDGRPVFVIELGRWNPVKYLDGGNETAKYEIYKRSEKLWYDSLHAVPQSESSEDGIVVIVDGQGFSPYSFFSKNALTALYLNPLFDQVQEYKYVGNIITAVAYQLWTMHFAEALEEWFVDIFVVNASFVIQQWLQLVRPVAGKMLGRANIISSVKTSIAAALVQKIPKNQLPPWFGGFKNYTPIAII